MTAVEFHESILRLLRQEPFRPFEIELSEGPPLRVESPEQISTGGGSAMLGTADGEIIFFDHKNTVRLGDAARAPA